ncbi:peptide chain release factor N(5)-glutamine methyltransferase [Amaricoccus sp.]|uniref:peptide chain release factor N(5)-glutamine methyltransferase n=1 Tax=Amaricoccus sp. TaxID=1872485 RepID=UPI001B44D48C|nr:peptide chain release factor N(5)-glutamine methyltransferase [Amaricoccus sp.]MBP7002852.1 peptide chain release factor N(5)-glutamine methyltransferase [Amaricoccus sp.]
MSTVQAAVAAAAAELAAAGVAEPLRDARALMAAALGLGASGLTPALRDPLAPEAAARFAGLVAARAARRPVAQILGRRAFWGRDFTVTADVLDPRPETEALVELALAGPAPARLLDLGVGSGAILATLLAEWPDAYGVGVDLSPAALAVAATNAAQLGVASRAGFVRGDWLAGIAGPFELVVANPPYIAGAEMAGLAPEVRDWEPQLALTPGPRGIEAYEAIAARLGAVLAPGGRALLEIGATQGVAVAAVFRAAGFAVALRPDLDGRDRVAEVR